MNANSYEQIDNNNLGEGIKGIINNLIIMLMKKGAT